MSAAISSSLPSSDLLRVILDNMAHGVIVVDNQGKIVVCNPAARALFGLNDDAASLPPIGSGLQVFLNDSVTACPPEQFPLACSLRGENVDLVELLIRHDQAAQGIWLSLTSRPLTDVGASPGGALLVCRDVTNRRRDADRQATQFAVTRALEESADLDHAGPAILRHICEGLGWDLGALLLVEAGENRLHCRGLWHHADIDVSDFADVTRRMTVVPGQGLPGRVWSSQQPLFIRDVTQDAAFLRTAPARRSGLVSGLAFPIRSGGETIGVIEAFSRRMDEPDADMLAMMATLGSQIGQTLQRQRAERALRESEAFYHALVESLPQNIYRKDGEGRVTFGNRNYCNTLNRPLHELIGKTDFDLFPAHLARKYIDDDRKVMESGKVFETVEAHHLPDGTQLHVQVIKLPVWDRNGKAIGTQGIFWDVTERIRAEEALAESERRYRQLIESAYDAIVVAGQDGRISLFNPAAERLFGYTAAEVAGRGIDVLIPEQFQDAHRTGFQRFLATRESKIIGRPVEVEALRKDGTTVSVEIVLSVVGTGGAIGFLGTIRDLTERNRMQAFLVQNEKLASIGLLSAGVAHEINNPLAFVANNLAVLQRDSKGLLELLDRHQALLPRLAELAPDDAATIASLAEEIDLAYLRENTSRLLARTRDGVERVTRIVRSLHGLARTDSPEREFADLTVLFDASLEILRGRLKRFNVEVVTTFDADSSVQCVANQISQVLLNLLMNAQQAIEATGRTEGGRINVTTKRVENEMLIEVSDNGTGIDPDHLPKLFDPFFTTKEVGEGTGLGLSIAHNIVQAHGGRIEVESGVGGGAAFRVYLPLGDSRA